MDTGTAATTAVATVDSWPAVAGLALILLGGPLVTYLQGRSTKKLAAQAAADAAQTREQTVNNHQDHPTPNLREQMDAQDERAERIEAGVAELVTAFKEHVASDEAWKTSVERELARRRPLLPWRF